MARVTSASSMRCSLGDRPARNWDVFSTKARRSLSFGVALCGAMTDCLQLYAAIDPPSILHVARSVCHAHDIEEVQVMGVSEKVAIVTGAGTGIGKCVALALMQHGFAVVLAGRRREVLDATAAEGTALDA